MNINRSTEELLKDLEETTEKRENKQDIPASPSLNKELSESSEELREEIGDWVEIEGSGQEIMIGDLDIGLTFEAIGDSIIVNFSRVSDHNELIVKYLSYDETAEPPSSWGDNSLFLVHYHRQFHVENRDIITEYDLRSWYQGESIDLLDDYYIFPVSSYIHSGVTLSITQRSFPFDPGGWDTSHVGAILASKEGWHTSEEAFESAKGLIETWNQYLSGEVYDIVKEVFSSTGESVTYDLLGGFYGFEDTKRALRTEI